MKRVFFLLVIVGACFASCTREYICQCTISYTGSQPGLPDTTLNEYIIKDTRNNALSVCKDHSNTSTHQGITYIEACQLY